MPPPLSDTLPSLGISIESHYILCVCVLSSFFLCTVTSIINAEVWGCFYTFSSVPWVSFSIHAPKPSCLNYYSFQTSPGNFVQVALFILDLLHFLMMLKSVCQFLGKRICWVLLGLHWTYRVKLAVKILNLPFWSFCSTHLGVAMKWEMIFKKMKGVIRSWDYSIPSKVKGPILPMYSIPCQWDTISIFFGLSAFIDVFNLLFLSAVPQPSDYSWP